MFGKHLARAVTLAVTVAMMLSATALANDKLTADADLVAGGLQQSYTNNALAEGDTDDFSFKLYVEVQSGGQEPTYPIKVNVESKPSWVAPVSSFPVQINGTGTANAVTVTFRATGQSAASSGSITFEALNGTSGVELSQSEIQTGAQSTFSVSVNPPAVTDSDNDGIADDGDNCPNDANTDQADADSDGIGNACEADTDGDGVIDDHDNCVNDANTDQADADSDGIGNACDSNSYAPAVATAAANATGDEGDTLQTSGSFSDQDGNGTLTITGDGVIDNGDGTWSWSLATTDDVSGTVTVTADDGEHLVAQDSFDYSAADVVPELSALALIGNSGTACVTGNTVGLSFSFTGASVDTIGGSIAWGDGSTESFSSSPVNTSHTYAAGSYTITVTLDDEDAPSAMPDDSDTAAVSLLYSAGGVLQPVNDTQAKNDPSIFKYGSTIPVKIRVTDCDNVSVSGLSPQIKVNKLNGSTPSGSDEPVVSTSGADSGTTMRYDAAGQIYIYNLATKSLADSSATYRLTITGPFAPVTTDFGTKAK